MEFLEDCLGYKLSGEFKKYPTRPHGNAQNLYMHAHPNVDISQILKFKNVRMIIPLRHPYCAYVTRNFKSGKVARLRKVVQAPYIKHWKTLIENAAKTEPAFLPVDSDLDRVKLLQLIANHLEAEPSLEVLSARAYQWPKIGTQGMSEEMETYLATGIIRGERPTFLDFAVEWYRSRIQSLEALQ